jgi:diguanylate cyclase (GGDEF)-like protein
VLLTVGLFIGKVRRWPTGAHPALLVVGGSLVAALIVFSRDGSGGFSLFYIWATAQGALFLARRGVLALVVVYAGLYGVALAFVADDDPVGHWLMLTATMVCIALIIGSVRSRTDTLLRLLVETARTDHLTGVLNRRGFEEALTSELNVAARRGHPVALIVGDLDHFKSVNDEFGHEAGDLVLREFAACVRENVRPGDHAGRLGGEEFAVVLPQTSLDEAGSVADRIRRAATRRPLVADRVVSATFGVAATDGGDGAAESLLRLADDALYWGKGQGRDRSCWPKSGHGLAGRR